MSHVPALHHCSIVTLSSLGLELLNSRIFPEIYSPHSINPPPPGLATCPSTLAEQSSVPSTTIARNSSLKGSSAL